jgi:hypothetical protein
MLLLLRLLLVNTLVTRIDAGVFRLQNCLYLMLHLMVE